ncbi:MEDS domain-containing protein [Geomesophilobacter sediminis]|uniref:histidine kinase n=1 Tax=Geomesophilobacter sediminis TaxID=2798584 RepID=A0A8J7SAP5_9BACT|nr:MEDS domain-containing protein [Geomesophilobacter sediminis]MBJ6727600.1 MEDS domain-containing protein [Geomesophilobacter sediminis]
MQQSTREPVERQPVEEIPSHDHLCLLYQGEAELIPAVVSFIEKGVKGGERCLYFNSGEQLLDRVLKNAVAAQKSGVKVLVSLSREESWTRGGGFDVGRVIAYLTELAMAAGSEGFKGVRFICDMGWAVSERVGGEVLMDFEARLNGFVVQHHASVLCLYNRTVFAPELLLEIVKLHPNLDFGGKICPNLLHVPTEQFQHPSRRASELEIFIGAMRRASAAALEAKQLRQELEQAYAALARKIYENWQEEDTLRASEQQIHEQDDALKEHKRRLRTILQHLPALLAAFDADHRLVSCNHEFERVTSYRAEEVMGKRMRDLFDPEAAEEMSAAHPASGGDYRGREWQIRTKDGGLRCVSWSNISKYVTITGWPNWIMGIDITQRVRVEDRLRGLSSEVNRHSRELEGFSYAVSHDLSGQVAKISGFCREMQEACGAALPQSCQAMLQQINDASVEMVERIMALLRFTMLFSGDLSPEDVDLSAMANEIAARLAVRAGERPVVFNIEEGIVVRGDEKLLRLAMEQLLENAWSSALREDHPVIHFGTAQVEGERSIFISDNGAREEAGYDNPFDPGWGGTSPLGRGIGLATVHKIISLHRGKIWAAETGAKGATLYFRV